MLSVAILYYCFKLEKMLELLIYSGVSMYSVQQRAVSTLIPVSDVFTVQYTDVCSKVW